MWDVAVNEQKPPKCNKKDVNITSHNHLNYRLFSNWGNIVFHHGKRCFLQWKTPFASKSEPSSNNMIEKNLISSFFDQKTISFLIKHFHFCTKTSFFWTLVVFFKVLFISSFGDFLHFSPIYCHLPHICHRIRNALYKGISRDVWQCGSKFKKNET